MFHLHFFHLSQIAKLNFHLQKVFCGNLKKGFSLDEVGVTLKKTSISVNIIATFIFPWNIFCKRKLTIKESDRKCFQSPKFYDDAIDWFVFDCMFSWVKLLKVCLLKLLKLLNFMFSWVKLLKIDNFTDSAYTKLSKLLHFGIKL